MSKPKAMKMVQPSTQTLVISVELAIKPDAPVYPIPVPFHLQRYIPKEYATAQGTIMLPKGKVVTLNSNLVNHIKNTVGTSWFIL